MEKIYARATQGATLGGIVGAAVGAILTVGRAKPMVGAIGTLIGCLVGGATGTAETVHDRKLGGC